MDQRLDLLMTYTTFHIGLYVSLITALLSFLTFYSKPSKGLYWTTVTAVLCFTVSGAFAGLIASSIPRHLTYNSFRENLSPYVLEGIWGMPFEQAAAAEHTFFWLGLIIAIGGVMWSSRPKK